MSHDAIAYLNITLTTQYYTKLIFTLKNGFRYLFPDAGCGLGWAQTVVWPLLVHG